MAAWNIAYIFVRKSYKGDGKGDGVMLSGDGGRENLRASLCVCAGKKCSRLCNHCGTLLHMHFFMRANVTCFILFK